MTHLGVFQALGGVDTIGVAPVRVALPAVTGVLGVVALGLTALGVAALGVAALTGVSTLPGVFTLGAGVLGRTGVCLAFTLAP